MAPKTCSKALSTNILNLFAGTHQSCPSSRLPFSSSGSSSVQRRKYAVINEGQTKSTDNPRDRCYSATFWPSHPNPTPYDIFALDRSTPYTKARFYDLVKLYHPDRHGHTQIHSHSHPHSHPHTHTHAQSPLSSATRLERYRLVILANDILSDPAKRRAYDACGAGWTHHHERDAVRDRTWRHHPDSAAHNATWEDWERWHARRRNGEEGGDKQQQQQPVFMSNAHFVALVLAAIAVGSALQASRARESATAVLGRREAIESEIGYTLARQKAERSGQGREERIERFLRDRENWAFGFAPRRYDEEPPGSSARRERASRHQNGG
ncbi:hypothetical protein SODALDRAFT_332969 [Sodiomyces alkalinus F11]|uniref:J domain-containing protein n=1 Tax=Sodiomyces alkalinus (strain CBS 110278 / VKM F-3762 / F11) TaxID=1314773 RepID=A0A3N2PVM0_SODAK|nr:hypothetical protein SODALDRAFT_332969 [Sodiomyces alkalinus F11]ROT38396.1 hypothetical protein SODALDRAFT_332969 [Sodiomyces alkalinus F11]